MVSSTYFIALFCVFVITVTVSTAAPIKQQAEDENTQKELQKGLMAANTIIGNIIKNTLKVPNDQLNKATELITSISKIMKQKEVITNEITAAKNTNTTAASLSFLKALNTILEKLTKDACVLMNDTIGTCSYDKIQQFVLMANARIDTYVLYEELRKMSTLQGVNSCVWLGSFSCKLVCDDTLDHDYFDLAKYIYQKHGACLEFSIYTKNKDDFCTNQCS